jgi:hypothetical protein
MKKTILASVEYTAPTLELFATVVESGFAASLEGGINDWVQDDDSIDC